MHFRRLDCDSSDKGARQFAVSNENARHFDPTFRCPNAGAARSNAGFDGTDANVPQADEFSS